MWQSCTAGIPATTVNNSSVKKKRYIPITWVKATTTNQRLLAAVPPAEFAPVQEEMTVGREEQETRVLQIADIRVTFPDLGERRVVVLETEAGTRLGIYTTALHRGYGVHLAEGLALPADAGRASAVVSERGDPRTPPA